MSKTTTKPKKRTARRTATSKATRPKRTAAQNAPAGRKRSRSAATQRRKTKPRRTSARDELARLFNQLPANSASFVASAALVAVGERAGQKATFRVSGAGDLNSSGGAVAPSKSPSRHGGTPAQRRRLAGFIEAVASSHRLTILSKLIQGPATFRALTKATRLKVGPLYHHVNRLRIAGLIAPKERDLYRVTRSGRDAMLILLAMLPLLGDTRVVD